MTPRRIELIIRRVDPVGDDLGDLSSRRGALSIEPAHLAGRNDCATCLQSRIQHPVVPRTFYHTASGLVHNLVLTFHRHV